MNKELILKKFPDYELIEREEMKSTKKEGIRITFFAEEDASKLVWINLRLKEKWLTLEELKDKVKHD